MFFTPHNNFIRWMVTLSIFIFVLIAKIRNIWLLYNFISYDKDIAIYFPVLRNMQLSSVQLLSRVQIFATPWTLAHQVSLSITNSQSLLKLMSIIVSDAFQQSHPLSSPSPPAFNLYQHQGLF